MFRPRHRFGRHIHHPQNLPFSGPLGPETRKTTWKNIIFIPRALNESMGDLNRTDFIFWGGFPPIPPQLPNLAPDGPRIPPEMCGSPGGFDPTWFRPYSLSSDKCSPIFRFGPCRPMYTQISPDPEGKGGRDGRSPGLGQGSGGVVGCLGRFGFVLGWSCSRQGRVLGSSWAVPVWSSGH